MTLVFSPLTTWLASPLQHDFKDKDTESFVRSLLDQNHGSRLGCGQTGINEILDHPYWRGIEWCAPHLIIHTTRTGVALSVGLTGPSDHLSLI